MEGVRVEESGAAEVAEAGAAGGREVGAAVIRVGAAAKARVAGVDKAAPAAAAKAPVGVAARAVPVGVAARGVPVAGRAAVLVEEAIGSSRACGRTAPAGIPPGSLLEQCGSGLRLSVLPLGRTTCKFHQ